MSADQVSPKPQSFSGAPASITLVCAFGGAGGFAAWLLMAATGGRLFPWSWYASVPAAVFLGAMAAGLGVYVLANTDLSNAGRALFFAALCGVFFKPVFSAGGDFIGGAISQLQATSSASAVNDADANLSKSLNSKEPQQVSSGVQQTGAATATLVQQSASVSDTDLRKELEQKSAHAVETIAAAAPAAPQAAVDSLLNIGKAAKENGQTNLTFQVLDSLKKVQETTKDPAVMMQAQQAAAEIQKSTSKPKS
jgi:hypothetical protein